jgi:hypothetical protein
MQHHALPRALSISHCIDQLSIFSYYPFRSQLGMKHMSKAILFALTLGLMLAVAFVSCNTKSSSEQDPHQAVSVKALGA